MNIVKIDGTVAEQMFQYAFYYALLQHDPSAKLDVPKGKWIKAMFRLPRFLEATPEELAVFGKAGFKNRLMSCFKKPAGEVFKEPENHAYVSGIFDKTDTYFEGEWLSPRYFESVAEELRQTYSVPAKHLPDRSQSMVNMLEQGKTVVINVCEPQGKESTCTPDYYNWAIANVLSAIPKAHFYVFTTDLEWAKNNLDFQGAQADLVEYPADKEIQLLPFLYHAQHIIMANTLTSWWAAWLIQNEDKIVIAPQQWSKNNDCVDLIPIHWTSIPTT